jgi:hypothetical protein
LQWVFIGPNKQRKEGYIMDNKPDNIIKRKPGRPKKLETKPDNTLPAADPVKRKRGRPTGSKNKIKTIRNDKAIHTEPGENTKFIQHDMKLYNLPKIDMENPEQVKARINEFFSICETDDIKPSIASLALSFGFSRFVLFDILNNRTNTVKNIESKHTLKTAYDVINSYYEHMMNYGKINPVAGIFLMKNNMGYKDTTDYIINTNQEREENSNDIFNRAGLLQDID